MKYGIKKSNGKIQINSKAVFIDCLNEISDLKSLNYIDFLDQCEARIYSEFKPHIGAISNVRGKFYEWLLTISSFAFQVNQLCASNFLLIPLPNVSMFEHTRLYEDEVYDLLGELKQQTEKYDVSLVTSNPDFVILKSSDLFKAKLDLEQLHDLDYIDEVYKEFIGLCSFTEILGYVSVKTSLRPDRRLQLPHEGAMAKSIYEHLRTRMWDIEAKNLKYFAAATVVGKQDVEALKTIATHSILSVNSVPERAVDKIMQVDSGDTLIDFLNHIAL